MLPVIGAEAVPDVLSVNSSEADKFANAEREVLVEVYGVLPDVGDSTPVAKLLDGCSE